KHIVLIVIRAFLSVSYRSMDHSALKLMGLDQIIKSRDGGLKLCLSWSSLKTELCIDVAPFLGFGELVPFMDRLAQFVMLLIGLKVPRFPLQRPFTSVWMSNTAISPSR